MRQVYGKLRKKPCKKPWENLSENRWEKLCENTGVEGNDEPSDRGSRSVHSDLVYDDPNEAREMLKQRDGEGQ